MAGYNIKSFCSLAGINEHTMRAWERRHGVVEPNRSDTNRRLYSKDDLERVRLLVKLVDRGHPISALAKLSMESLKDMIVRMDSMNFEDTCTDNIPQGYALQNLSLSSNEYIKSAIDSLQSENPWELRLVIREARNHLNLEDFLLEYIPNLMHKVGLLVFQGKIRIWRSHILGTAIKQELVSANFDVISGVRRPSKKELPTLIGTTIEGDFHELGSFIAMILANFAGLGSHFLGPALPAREVSEAVKNIPNSIAVIGVSEMPPGILPRGVLDYIRELREYLGDEHEIWVGGNLDGFSQADFEDIPRVKIFPSLIAYRSELERMINQSKSIL